MALYPVNLNLAGRKCAVVGGGGVAGRKIAALLASEALVTVISPDLTPALKRLVRSGRIAHIGREYRAGDLADCFLVICAASDRAANRRAAEEAAGGGALVNVADDPDKCDFEAPAQVARGALLLTVSTGGRSPALARAIRRELAARYGEEYGLFLERLAYWRAEARRRLGAAADRERFWRDTMDESCLELLRQGKLDEAEAKIRDAIGSFGTQS